MSSSAPKAVVAGHICLDIIPALIRQETSPTDAFRPGMLINVGPAVLATGGAVSNTGLALHRLGVGTRLIGKIGDDPFGRCVQEILGGHGPHLADGMIVSTEDATSYTVVLSPPGADRMFLHCPGANDTFRPGDIDVAGLGRTRLFHFGYPPLMRAVYDDGGAALGELLAALSQRGVTTSLDLALPDPASPAGRADWKAFLATVAPHTDVLLPSIDEILFMTDRPCYDRLTCDGADLSAGLNGDVLSTVAKRLLGMGPAVVALKLGAAGLYLRTTDDADRLAKMGGCTPTDVDDWTARELLSPCLEVDVVGTTGAGDCTIAGFLHALLDGSSAEEALTRAVAVGACSVEAADATSGVRRAGEVQRRLRAGWQRRENTLSLSGWRKDGSGIWFGPHDARR